MAESNHGDDGSEERRPVDAALRLLVVAMVGAAGCGSRGASVLPVPTTPVPNPPAISCPADLTGEARVGALPRMSFDTPPAQDGQPPVNVNCEPASGSEFPVGVTTVTCEAADALGRKAACRFDVTIGDIPRIEKTRFMAFGDSITEGKLGVRSTSPSQPSNYAEKLRAKLQARYELQTITMVNEAESSEPTGSGKYRFQGAFLQARPDVVTLLEGTNDLIGAQDKGTIDSAVDALQSMVQFAKSRNARVFIATLPPMNGGLFNLRDAAVAVPVLNARIRSMAASEQVTVVDLEAAMSLELIGADGKHPTALGYQKIADTFFDAVRAAMEIRPSAPLQNRALARVRR